MSQREAAPGPNSRRSSNSPFKLPEPVPAEEIIPGSASVLSEVEISAPSAPSRGNAQQTSQYPLGMTSILNPLEQQQGDAQHSSPSPVPPAAPASSYQSWPHAGRRSIVGSQVPPSAASQPHGRKPVQASTITGGSTGRSSPTAQYPFPNIGEHDSPRSNNMSQPPGGTHGTRPDLDHRARLYRPAISPAKREHEGEAPDEPRWRPQPRHSIGIADVSTMQFPPPTRSTSQPTSLQGGSDSGQHAAGPSTRWFPRGSQDQNYRSQISPFQPATAQGSAVQAPTALPPARPSNSPSPWADAVRRATIGGGSTGMEAQQAFMTLPGTDIQIPVQVDYSQASKKADEKRQRNAKASTRHRRKKKTIQEENVRQLQEVKDEREQLADDLDHMRRQRDFYRDERNRLREIVSRTPGIQQHAAGPPSPTPTRSTGSHSDRSPSMQAPSRMTIHNYIGDLSPPDRSRSMGQAQEDRQEYAGQAGHGIDAFQLSGLALPPGQTYSQTHHPAPLLLPPSSSLPHPPADSHYSRPGHSSGVAERFPSLTEPAKGPSPQQSVPAEHGHERDPRTGHWRQTQNPHVEGGWATGARPPAEGPHRQW